MSRPTLTPLRALLRPIPLRHLHTSSALRAAAPAKVPVSQIAALRKLRPVPMQLAREALERSSNDIDGALSYLDSASSASASKKAAKVAGRHTGEGVVAISLLGGKRVGMVQVGCETDFVARNDVFLGTARGIAGTVAFLDVPGQGGHEAQGPVAGGGGSGSATADPIHSFPTDALLSAPLITLPTDSTDAPAPSPEPTTVSQHLLSSLSQTGENLRLLRAASFAAPFPSSAHIRYVPGAYAHGSPSPAPSSSSSSSSAIHTEGKVGGIVIISAESTTDKPMAARVHGAGGDKLEQDLLAVARTLARQVVGFPTVRVERPALVEGEVAPEEECLLSQPAMMFGKDSTVEVALREWAEERGLSVKVVGMRRWAVGEAMEDAAEGGAAGV